MVDGDSERLYDVMLDDHDLRTGVEDCQDLDTAIDEDVELLEGETECLKPSCESGTWGLSRTGVSRGNRPIIVPLACDCVVL